MIVVLIFFFGIALILAVNYPNYFLLFYILATTKFLGFLDPSTFVVGGVELGYFMLNLIAVFGVLFQPKWYIISWRMLWFICFILIMLLYGIVKPFLDGNSSLFHGFIASKEIWFYFIFLYVIVYQHKIDNLQLLKFIKILGIYLSVVYIIGNLNTRIVPPIYYNGSHVRTFFPTYISLSIFIYAIRIKYDAVKSLKDRIIVIILFLGLILASHFSLTIMTIVGFVLFKYVYNKRLELNAFILTRFGVIVIFVGGIVLASFTSIYNKLITNVEGIITGEDNALSSRNVYNQFRWEAIEKKKELGYGFIHQSSKFMKEIKLQGTNRFMERFTVIDSGYIDLLIKFGYIGTIIITTVFVGYYSQGFFKNHKNPLSLAMSIYLMQYVFMNYTWSVFTFAHGIVPGIIAYYLLITSNDVEPEVSI